MQQFLVLSIGRGLDPADGDEQTQAHMVEWFTWINGLAESGTFDSGGPLDPTGREVSKDTITDTMMESIGIGSYLIINAESLDDAARIMQGSPHMALGGRFIVRPRLDGSNRDPTYTPR